MARYIEYEDLKANQLYVVKTYDGEVGRMKFKGGDDFEVTYDDFDYFDVGDIVTLLGDVRYAYFEYYEPPLTP